MTRMTMVPVPPDEQAGLAEEWAEREPAPQPEEPPTEDLRPKRRERKGDAAQSCRH